MKIILFGNRGSRPLGASVDSPFEKYGGDTTAVGILCGERLVALDAGSGFWKWPYTLNTILGRTGPQAVDLFFSHYHTDHTMGLAQSPLLFTPGNRVDFYGPPFAPGLKGVFNAQANRPFNPELSRHYKAALSFTTLPPGGGTLALDADTAISWICVPHGGEESYGYRIDHKGRSFCAISDTNHSLDDTGAPVLSAAIVDFIRGADALLYDSHYADAEFMTNPALYGGMGHSTGEHGVRLCAAAGVPLFIKHHHDPNKTDDMLDRETDALQSYGAAHGVAVIAAQPSLCLDLSLPPAQRLSALAAQATPRARYAAITAPSPAP